MVLNDEKKLMIRKKDNERKKAENDRNKVPERPFTTREREYIPTKNDHYGNCVRLRKMNSTGSYMQYLLETIGKANLILFQNSTIKQRRTKNLI